MRFSSGGFAALWPKAFPCPDFSGRTTQSKMEKAEKGKLKKKGEGNEHAIKKEKATDTLLLLFSSHFCFSNQSFPFVLLSLAAMGGFFGNSAARGLELAHMLLEQLVGSWVVRIHKVPERGRFPQ